MNITFYRPIQTKPALITEVGAGFAKFAGMSDFEVAEFGKPPAVILASAFGDYATYLVAQRQAEITAALRESGDIRVRTRLKGTNIPNSGGRKSKVKEGEPKGLRLDERNRRGTNTGEAMPQALKEVLLGSARLASAEGFELGESTSGELIGMGTYRSAILLQTPELFTPADVTRYSEKIGNPPGLSLGPVMPAIWDTEDDLPVSFGSLNG